MAGIRKIHRLFESRHRRFLVRRDFVTRILGNMVAATRTHGIRLIEIIQRDHRADTIHKPNDRAAINARGPAVADRVGVHAR